MDPAATTSTLEDEAARERRRRILEKRFGKKTQAGTITTTMAATSEDLAATTVTIPTTATPSPTEASATTDSAPAPSTAQTTMNPTTAAPPKALLPPLVKQPLGQPGPRAFDTTAPLTPSPVAPSPTSSLALKLFPTAESEDTRPRSSANTTPTTNDGGSISNPSFPGKTPAPTTANEAPPTTAKPPQPTSPPPLRPSPRLMVNSLTSSSLPSLRKPSDGSSTSTTPRPLAVSGAGDALASPATATAIAENNKGGATKDGDSEHPEQKGRDAEDKHKRQQPPPSPKSVTFSSSPPGTPDSGPLPIKDAEGKTADGGKEEGEKKEESGPPKEGSGDTPASTVAGMAPLQPTRPPSTRERAALEQRLRFRTTRLSLGKADRDKANKENESGSDGEKPDGEGAKAHRGLATTSSSLMSRLQRRRRSRENQKASKKGPSSDSDDSSDSGKEEPPTRNVRPQLQRTSLHLHRPDLGRFVPQAVVSALQHPLPFKLGLGVFTAANAEATKKLDSLKEEVNSKQVAAVHILECDFSSVPDAIQPLVRFHVLDGSTGRYLRQDPPKRKDSAESEEGQPKPTALASLSLAPYTTKPFPLFEGSSVAQWCQRLVVDIPYTRFFHPNVLILLEVYDYAAVLSSRKSRRRMRASPLAWAFLRTINLRGKANIETTDSDSAQPVRLQLYSFQILSPLTYAQAQARGLMEQGIPSVYLQYLCQHKVKVTAALAVRVVPTARPNADARLSITRPIQQPDGGLGMASHPSAREPLDGGDAGDKEAGSKNIMENLAGSGTSYLRRRGKHDPCLLPDKLLHRLTAGTMGASAVRFSFSGRQLAVACCSSKVFVVRIYDPETGHLLHELRPPHFSIIYDVRWSEDDRHLISASGDGTCHIWRINAAPYLGEDELAVPDATEAGETEKPAGGSEEAAGTMAAAKYHQRVITLQHCPPCYIYCADFVQASISVSSPKPGGRNNDSPSLGAITGAFDASVRIWDVAQGRELGLLGGTILHDRYVNTITMDRRMGRVYTGDGDGIVVVWKRNGEPLDPQGYSVLHRLNHPDLAGRPLTSLMIHPRRRKGQLLVLAHQNCLRLVDLFTYRSANSGYPGVKCNLSKITAVFSPDGRYVAAGSEDGKIRVWESQTAKPVISSLEHVGFTEPLLGISWHPHEHVVALAAYGENMPVLLYWTEKASGGGERVEGEGVDVVVPVDAKRAEEARKRAQEEKERRMERLREIKEKLGGTVAEEKISEGKMGEEKGYKS